MPVSTSEKPAVVCLMGPTACGKTDIAMSLVQQLNAEIISVDSAMIYRGMDIGTAKPTKAEQAIAPHRLIDICEPAETYSAAKFAEDATREINEILAVGKLPLLVGGTMLYYKALQQGLALLPEADPVVRMALEQEAAELGWPAMHQKLSEVDPLAALRIKPTDSQRIQRALEVYRISGSSMTELHQQQQRGDSAFEFINLALMPPDREILRERIRKRFKEMLNRGFIAEVEGLYSRAELGPELPALRCVGYRQVWGYLAGKLDYAEMEEQGVIATSQLAKRQMTWLRGSQEAQHLNSDDPNVLNTVLSTITACLN